MIHKWNLPLTYEPKIQPVINKDCLQTTRAGQKFKLGDLIAFHGWSGRPYWSPWSFRTPYFELDYVNNIQIMQDGLMFESCTIPGVTYTIPWRMCGSWARWDGIVPPTGEEYGRVLLSMNKVPITGLPGQIIRWKP